MTLNDQHLNNPGLFFEARLILLGLPISIVLTILFHGFRIFLISLFIFPVYIIFTLIILRKYRLVHPVEVSLNSQYINLKMATKKVIHKEWDQLKKIHSIGKKPENSMHLLYFENGDNEPFRVSAEIAKLIKSHLENSGK